MVKGYSDWKHAVEANKGFYKHATSKEHLTCMVMWTERDKRSEALKEICKLVNADQLKKNRYYMSAIIDMVEFLGVNQMPLKGNMEAFDDMADGGSGLFLSLFDYTVKTKIQRNATYTSHDMKNKIIGIMTDAIIGEIGESWYTIKVDRTRDPTGCENISTVIHFVSETNKLLTIATADRGRTNSKGQSQNGVIISPVSAILANLNDITSVLTEIDTVQKRGSGQWACCERCPSPALCSLPNWWTRFHSSLTPPNKLLQAEDTDLLTGLRLVAVGYTNNNKTELPRLYFDTIDAVLGEMDMRFGEHNTELASGLVALDPESEKFLDIKAIKMDLTNSTKHR
ncbi:Zinc finger MYM-type protein 1 [Merluccius polli]|uniref:Zinc finger MYM-type protein 1 n=1 Tax=Merluccius polli TaxID=89951 RepID=A0AA47NTJ1_MERPO|nr:Zinc finger MYM-type protein 1 [Merluccius polli]